MVFTRENLYFTVQGHLQICLATLVEIADTILGVYCICYILYVRTSHE